jgi:hypothetical protein
MLNEELAKISIQAEDFKVRSHANDILILFDDEIEDGHS